MIWDLFPKQITLFPTILEGGKCHLWRQATHFEKVIHFPLPWIKRKIRRDQTCQKIEMNMSRPFVFVSKMFKDFNWTKRIVKLSFRYILVKLPKDTLKKVTTKTTNKRTMQSPPQKILQKKEDTRCLRTEPTSPTSPWAIDFVPSYVSLDTRHVTKWAPSYCNKEPMRCQSCRRGPLWWHGFVRGVCPEEIWNNSNSNNGFPCFNWFCFWGRGMFLLGSCKLVFTGSGRGCAWHCCLVLCCFSGENDVGHSQRTSWAWTLR